MVEAVTTAKARLPRSRARRERVQHTAGARHGFPAADSGSCTVALKQSGRVAALVGSAGSNLLPEMAEMIRNQNLLVYSWRL